MKVRIGQGWDVDVAENTRRDKDCEDGRGSGDG